MEYSSSKTKASAKKEKTDVDLGIQVEEVQVSTESHSYQSFYEAESALMGIFVNETQKLYQKTFDSFHSEQKRKLEMYQTKLLSITANKDLKQNAFLAVFDQHKIRLDNIFTCLKQFAKYYWRLKRKRAIFQFWVKYSDRRRYHNKMTVYSRNFYKRAIVRSALRCWKTFRNAQVKSRETTRWTIKLTKEIEVLKAEYTSMIDNLQILYQKRMQELAEEEQQHKEMFAKFSGLTEIKKLEQSNIH